ncbi:MAG: phosphate/phosphite/phosphonate ABC transporter substrate-binding protein [Bdellovibrio sp.]|nr:phosphate/phosphite/phosphonate ABC transporter substrate-binding protein [Bdellovibrio sp.]
MGLKSLAIIVLFIFQAVHASADSTPLTIGLLPGGDPKEIEKQSFVFAEKLQAKLGKPVQIFISKNYDGLVEAIKAKKVDFAIFSALTYVIAEKQTPLKVLLKKTWDGPFYFSALIVRKESKIKSIKDLKNKNILFVDEKSTSGYLYPQIYLRKNKLTDASFKSVKFSGNHAASIDAMENRKADVAAVFADDEKSEGGAWNRFAKNKSVKYRTIWISEPIPNDPIVVRQDFYERNGKLTHEVMYDMIEVQNEAMEQSSLQEILGHGSLMPATQKQYDPVREMVSVFEKQLKL